MEEDQNLNNIRVKASKAVSRFLELSFPIRFHSSDVEAVCDHFLHNLLVTGEKDQDAERLLLLLIGVCSEPGLFKRVLEEVRMNGVAQTIASLHASGDIRNFREFVNDNKLHADLRELDVFAIQEAMNAGPEPEHQGRVLIDAPPCPQNTEEETRADANVGTVSEHEDQVPTDPLPWPLDIDDWKQQDPLPEMPCSQDGYVTVPVLDILIRSQQYPITARTPNEERVHLYEATGSVDRTTGSAQPSTCFKWLMRTGLSPLQICIMAEKGSRKEMIAHDNVFYGGGWYTGEIRPEYAWTLLVVKNDKFPLSRHRLLRVFPEYGMVYDRALRNQPEPENPILRSRWKKQQEQQAILDDLVKHYKKRKSQGRKNSKTQEEGNGRSAEKNDVASRTLPNEELLTTLGHLTTNTEDVFDSLDVISAKLGD